MSHSILPQAQFDAAVLRAEVPVLVAFTASWCGPCKVQKPILDKLADEGTKVVSVDLDEAPALATRYAVRGAPTLLVFKGGAVVARQFGVADKRRLHAMLANEPPSAAR